MTMKRFWIGFLALTLTGMIFAQSTPAPQLSTADKVAIQSLEKVKGEARKQFDDASQEELTVLREWAAAHPGWTVNPQTFVVEKAEKASGEKVKGIGQVPAPAREKGK